MSSYDVFSGDNKIGFIYPYQDLLVKMSSAAETQNYTAYVDLVAHLRNMCILSFDKQEAAGIRRVVRLMEALKRHVEKDYKARGANREIRYVEKEAEDSFNSHNLKVFCDYCLSGVIERICIFSLRRTIFKDQALKEANSSYFPSEDIDFALESINRVLEEFGIKKFEEMV